MPNKKGQSTSNHISCMCLPHPQLDSSSASGTDGLAAASTCPSRLIDRRSSSNMASRSLRSVIATEPSTPFYSPLQFSLNASSRDFQLDPGGSQVNPRQGTSTLPWPPRSSFAVAAPQTAVDVGHAELDALADSMSVMPGSPRSQQTFGFPQFHTL
ncbi:hypothetical protein N656DRAFT_58173 [Canariomyces notabilis]|uniref:Uncharacterized protein n=1 Tax=Canariomyces notabilis TaxID=2074819 RepID=A0AAN6TNI3_9PEZI|nr:hypothetical protein N656DRAFT_58173 [Canariomyces arenarius]